MKKPSTEGFFKTRNVVADDKLLWDLKDVRTKADKIRILASKVYHFFQSSKSEHGDTENQSHSFGSN